MNIATFNRTAVSLGLGRIERAILAIVDVEDEYEQSYAAEDLAIDIFRPGKALSQRPVAHPGPACCGHTRHEFAGA